VTRVRSACTVIALTSGAVLALVAAAPQGQAASASAPHRAAVVVDLGDGQVKVGCVSFTQDHLSGLEALDRASMSPVAQTYGGQGSAVCALCGKGCTAGSTCLTCKAPNYWAYYHDGTYSSAGAGQIQVRDGDIEGWRWGKGERPTNVPFDRVCPVSAGPSPTPSPPVSHVSPVVPVVPVAPQTKLPTRVPSKPPAVGGGNGGRTTVAPTGPATSGPTTSVVGTAVPTTNARTATTSASSTAPAPSTAATPGSSRPASGRHAVRKQPKAGDRSAAIRRKPVVIERAGAKTRTSSVASDTGGSTSQWSIAAFIGAIAIVGGLIAVLRRRRAATG